MDLSLQQVQGIVDTLPIGYYAGRRVSVTVKEKESASYYNTVADSICISYDQVMRGVDKMQTYAEAQSIIRSNFYHEVSHAIATPTKLEYNDVLNIAEDERIERLFKDYYYGVDFKKQLYAIAGNPSQIGNDPIGFWFLLCRYGIGDPAFLSAFDGIMCKYWNMMRNATYTKCERYQSEILNLYRKLFDDVNNNPDKYQQLMQSLEQGDTAQSLDIETTGREAEKDCKIDTSKLRALVSKAITDSQTQKFAEMVNALFENYHKKNSGGSCLQGYSGVLNPRNADRLDYRLFDRSTTRRGNNSFGTFHLNLFIDTSGSFGCNQNRVNQMLATLEAIERKNSLFTFDVIALGTSRTERILPKNTRQIQCAGGTYLSKKVEDLYRQVQKPMTYNYNIILFDGDAYASYEEPKYKYDTDGQGFKVFDNAHCTIISDRDNREYIQTYASNARTIITGDYAEKLMDNVLVVLQRALT